MKKESAKKENFNMAYKGRNKGRTRIQNHLAGKITSKSGSGKQRESCKETKWAIAQVQPKKSDFETKNREEKVTSNLTSKKKGERSLEDQKGPYPETYGAVARHQARNTLKTVGQIS